jgi:gas vesicle protein
MQNDDRSLLRSSVQEKASSSDGRERKLYINKVPPPEGRSVRCVEDPKRVFRWTDKQLRHYPSGKIASSWDPEWRDVVSLECAGLDIASPMSLNYGDLPPSNRRPKVTNNDPDPSWTDHFESMGDQIEEVQSDMYDEIEEVQSDMYDEIEEVRNHMYDHTEDLYTSLSEVQGDIYDEIEGRQDNMYDNIRDIEKYLLHEIELLHARFEDVHRHIEEVQEDMYHESSKTLDRLSEQDAYVHTIVDEVDIKIENCHVDLTAMENSLLDKNAKLQTKNHELEAKITAMAKMIEKLISNDDNLFSQEEKDLLKGF